MPSFKILTNVPYQIKFLYDQPKVWENTDDQGKTYRTYSYGVEINQKNEYLGVSEKVNDMLQLFGPLSARTIEVQKVQDPNDLKKIHWIFKENGVELIPKRQDDNISSTSQKHVQFKLETKKDHSDCEMTFAKMRTAFKELEKRIESLETLTEPLTTEDAKRLHESLAGTSKTIEMAVEALNGKVEDSDFPRKV